MGVKIFADKPRIYFDMDGVLADFEREGRERNIPFSELKLKIDAYRHLPVMAGAKEAVTRAIEAGFEIFVLTKIPTKNPYAATEKLFWIEDHFPEFEGHVIISPDKGAVGNERDILIDDHPEWANASNFGGTVLKFEGNWTVLFDEIAKRQKKE